MVNKLEGGDYVAQGSGIVRLEGAEAAFANALFCLQCRRGSFPFLPTLGSRLWQLGMERPGDRTACARQFCTEALQDTGVALRSITVSEQEGALAVELELQLGTQSQWVEVSV